MSEDKKIGKTDREPDSTGSLGGAARIMQEMVMSTVRSGPVYHPIFDKFETQHVTQFLKDSSESDAAKHKMRMGNRWFRLAYVVLATVVFIFLTMFLLPDQSDLYFQILQGLGLFVAGLAGGYGIRSYQEKQ